MLLTTYTYASTGINNLKKTKLTYPSHTCTYRLYSNGSYVGTFSVYDVPNDMGCDLSAVKSVAIDGWNNSH